MSVPVEVTAVTPRIVAAVRREVVAGGVGLVWRPALDMVWDAIRREPGLWTGGHNVFIYHHPTKPGAPLVCDFGVEVTRPFTAMGEVVAVETPGGEAAVAAHRGPYDGLAEAHDAIAGWMSAHGRESGGCSWEIYGDPTPDPADTVTTVAYLLSPVA